ncbi:hypothetical protein DNV67_10680 [Salmonella enterica subsp. enterica serovar Napoli]|uniref:Uncharacterized protein n=1 Tax=Salmonella enterica subsp. enterica serovar Napoli TaxID=1151001 RepID=A0A702QJB3_SALET|nr:hypothetical protein [Salmonella enterica]EBR0211375.1 hypothetical protein [Salmonella enterica subsp. enterica serovar Napoli]EAN2628959.1 hypothetical protein [Salmonella enterica]EBI6080222.1 hypothetical protein [Salmonella enterica]EBS5960889.1 hypothetical protein [Salmonella enterica subsp. enterica serovar Napoli]
MVIHHRALQRSPCVFRATGALAALAHPSHIVNYAAGDVLACRLPVTRNPLGEGFYISLPLRGGVGIGFVGPISSAPSGISWFWL